jgi:hypothetical protein
MPTHFDRRATILLLGALVGGVAGGLGVALAQDRLPGNTQAALPQRNLLVELRQVEQTEAQDQGAGVAIRSEGRLGGSADVRLHAGSQRREGDVMQQVRVLNGAQASMRLGQAMALQGWQLAWTPQGVQALPGTQWVEAVSGFVVRPAWPGGEQPVRVELSAEGGSLPADPAQPAPRRTQVLSTVQVPLGQWVEVARSGEAASTSERGVLSTRELQGRQRMVIELRITAP